MEIMDDGTCDNEERNGVWAEYSAFMTRTTSCGKKDELVGRPPLYYGGD